MHSTNINNIIGTQESVYKDSSVGKLERNRFVETIFIPHQQGFDRDNKACFSIRVHNLSTIDTLEECIVGTMSALSHSTAVATPFRGMVGITNCESDVLIEAPAFNGCFEQQSRHSQNFFIESPTFWFEPLEILNRNVSIVFESHVGDVSYDFTNAILDKVPLFTLEFSEAFPCPMASFVGETLELLHSFKYLLSLSPDVLSEIGLLEDFSLWSQDSNSEALTIDIDSEHIPSYRNFGFFEEESNNLRVRCQPISLTYPTILNQGGVSLIVPVSFNRDSDTISRIHPKLNKELTLCRKGLAVSGNIELDSDALEFVALDSDNISLDVTNNLTIEGGNYFAS